MIGGAPILGTPHVGNKVSVIHGCLGCLERLIVLHSLKAHRTILSNKSNKILVPSHQLDDWHM